MKVETTDLILLPAEKCRDNEKFIEMLRDGGAEAFKKFCGIDYTEEALAEFNDYFEEEEEFLYAIFDRNNPDNFIGYCGFGLIPQFPKQYAIEFYIARNVRRRGYAKQAIEAICKSAFEGVLYNKHGVKFEGDEIHAEVFPDNVEAIGTLENVGFVRDESITKKKRKFIAPDWNVVVREVITYIIIKDNSVYSRIELDSMDA